LAVMELKLIAEKLKKEKKIALFCHVRPDGDTIGASFALKHGLEYFGIPTDVYCDDIIPERFDFILQGERVKNTLSCGEYSALVSVDCADVTRLGAFTEEFLSFKNTYNIDHHVSNNHYAKANYVVDKSANCQNVYDLLMEMNYPLEEKVANFLAMGLCTDTGAFRHKNVTAETLFTASKLVEAGADLNKICFYMFTRQSKERARLFGITMQKIRYYLEGKFAVAITTLADVEKSGANPDETEGFIDFVMGIKGVEVGACLLEMAPDKFKVSLRSKGADVSGVASTFGGGGHTLASGCRINAPLEEVVDKLTFAVSRYLPE